MLRMSVVSPTATYQLNTSLPVVDESGAVTITLNTTGVQNGQAIPYTISGAGITSTDFVGAPALTGNFIVQNGVAYFTLTTAADVSLEGPETFRVTLNDNGAYISVDITDTSAIQPGETWTYRGTLPGATSITRSIYFNGMYIASDASAANSAVFTSTAGVSWTNVGRPGDLPAGVVITAFASNGPLLFAGMSNGTISYTPNGVNWTNVPGPSGTAFGSVSITAIVWAGTQFIAAGEGAVTATSPDGITWTNRGVISVWPSYLDRTVRGLAWTGVNVVAVGIYGCIARSTNGITWEGGAAQGNSDNKNVVVANGATVVVGSSTTNGKILVSYNHGVDWTVTGGYITGNNITSGAFVAGKFILAGDKGALVRSETGGTWINDRYLYDNGFYYNPITSISSSGMNILLTTATEFATSP